jgi:hypothetical protein
VTHLREVMLEELERRNFSQATTRAYLGAVERFARFFGKPPDQRGYFRMRRTPGVNARELSKYP